MSGRSLVKAALGFQPRQHILPDISFRFLSEVQTRHPEPFDLARTHLKEIGDLLPGQECRKCLVARLLPCCLRHISPLATASRC